MTDFLLEMDQLAAEIAKAARQDVTDLDIKIDAFKALVPYYVQQMKKAGGEDDSSGDDFSTFTAAIHATEKTDGPAEPGVRDSRRNGN